MMKRNLLFILVISGCFAILEAQEYVLEDFHVSDSTGYNYQQPALSVGPAGGVVYSWEHGGANGMWMKTLSYPEYMLSDIQRVTAPFYHDRSWICHNADGGFMIMFAGSTTSWKLFGQLYDADGNEEGDTLTVTLRYAEFVDWLNASLSLNEQNQYVVMFPGHDSVMVERISSDGELQGELLALVPEAAFGYNLKGVAVPAGGFIVSWVESGTGGLKVQLFNDDGSPKAGPVEVRIPLEGHSVNAHAISCDPSGNFVVAWEETGINEKLIYTQLFTSGGEKSGIPHEIIDPLGIYKSSLSLDMDEDGKFVVAWSDGRRGDTTFIFLQQMDQAGEPAGSNMKATRVNDTSANEGHFSSQTGCMVRIRQDTIYLVWENFDENRYYTSEIYASIRHWIIDDGTGILPRGPDLDLKIFPNPSTGRITILYGASTKGEVTFEIFNSLGILVQQRTVAHAAEYLMDLSALPAGWYYLRVNTGERSAGMPLMLLDH